MIWRWLADLVVLVHVAFVVFVVVGGFLVLRWPWVAWLHVPAAVWGSLIEFAHWVCPLTYVENAFRARAGEAGYTGFIQHYLLRALYPNGLTPAIQWALGSFALVVNVVAYGLVIWQRRRASQPLQRESP
jgi:hypothetical protein